MRVKAVVTSQPRARSIDSASGSAVSVKIFGALTVAATTCELRNADGYNSLTEII